MTRASVGAPEGFLVGGNEPWIAYGHDVGNNAWGHDGFTTSGWTYQTWQDSQGFTDTRRSTEKAYTGVASLRIAADLVGGHPNKSRGEVYNDLHNHRPSKKAACGFIDVPINLEGVTVRCRLWLPKCSAGDPHAPNGVQLFFKSEGWWSWYSRWENILSEWEERWVELTVSLADPPGYKDPGFNPKKVIAAGLKVAINDSSTATLQGAIYLDDYVLETDPSIIFDFEQLEVASDFQALQQVLQGCATRVIRVFVFGDGRAAPDFSQAGEVKGFDEDFFPDFDALVTAAEQQDLLLVPVLVDFGWCETASFENGVQLGGHSDIIRDPTKRQTFLDRALKPLAERYCDNPQILAWEVCNEPEWAMKDIPDKSFEVGDPVTIADMQEFVRMCAQTVHACSSQKVTVGSARLKWMLDYWKGGELDLYQFHWYDHLADPFPWSPYAELGLDKPCFIGEVPTANSQYSVGRYLQVAHERGYHGVLVWSYRASDDFSDFCRAQPDLERWCTSPHLSLRLNKTSFSPRDILTLTGRVTPEATPRTADVYVAIQLPNSTFLFMEGDGSFTTEIKPIVRSWTISSFSGQIFSYTFSGGEAIGTYTWYAAFTEPGTINIIGDVAQAPFTLNP